MPGEDYEVIAITADMLPAEKRKARIANAKAKSAAVKALKASAPVAAATPVQPQADAPVADAAVAAPAPVGVGEPVAGVDYEVIEITDDMSPDEVRKARISNVKAKSAAMKAYKASAAAAPVAEPVSESVAQSPAPEVDNAATVPSNVAPPDLIEIADDMAPDEVRKARIHNAKAKAAYKKALKAAGIDPSTV